MNYTLRNLVVASLLMLLGIVAVISFIRGERQDLSRGKQEVQVFIAAKDIPAGTPADELESGGFLESKDVLREDAPPQAVGKMSTIEGLVSNETVYTGEYVNYTAFDKTAGLKPTAQIKGNERLFSLPIKAAADAAGLIRAGDHVDIFVANDGGFTYVAARDVEIIETPQTLTPEGVEVEATAPEANGDTKLYVVKATDREQANIKFGLSNADEYGLMLSLRPASGDAETKIPPLVPQLKIPEKEPSGTQPAPDPSIR
ncbi:MAG: cpaB [Thermoleophilia bacterium]|nr:cpaB [Thermoleophilia bacterium]